MNAESRLAADVCPLSCRWTGRTALGLAGVVLRIAAVTAELLSGVSPSVVASRRAATEGISCPGG